MDTKKTGREIVPQLQQPLLGLEEFAGAGTTKKRVYQDYGKKLKSNNQRRIANREKYREIARRSYYKNRHKFAAYAKKRYQQKKEQIAEQQSLRRRKLHNEVILAYGGICRCCFENKPPELLSIDHIDHGRNNPKPKEDRRANFYYKLKQKNYPSGFQVLCHDCNLAKGFYGSCPHSQMKTPIDKFYFSSVSA